jgi:hypothetical protein
MTLYSGANGNFYKFNNLQSDYLTQHNTDLVTIFDHNHTNNPIHGTTAIQAGTITAASIADGTITSAKLAAASSELVIANDTYKKWRNAANNADLNVITVNSSDQLEFEQDVAKIRFQYNTTVKGETSGGSDHNLFKVNSSTQWELLNTMYSQTVAPKTNSTYDLGTSSLAYALGYIDNLRITAYTSSTNFYDQNSFTPTYTGGTSAGVTTYTSQTGYYVRIGKLCFCQVNFGISGATGTGDIVIGALPFTAANTANIGIGGAAFNTMTLPGSTVHVNTQVVANSTTAKLYSSKDAAAAAYVQIDAACDLYLSFCYIVA